MTNCLGMRMEFTFIQGSCGHGKPGKVMEFE